MSRAAGGYAYHDDNYRVLQQPSPFQQQPSVHPAAPGHHSYGNGSGVAGQGPSVPAPYAAAATTGASRWWCGGPPSTGTAFSHAVCSPTVALQRGPLGPTLRHHQGAGAWQQRMASGERATMAAWGNRLLLRLWPPASSRRTEPHTRRSGASVARCLLGLWLRLWRPAVMRAVMKVHQATAAVCARSPVVPPTTYARAAAAAHVSACPLTLSACVAAPLNATEAGAIADST